jgi:trans-2,3-dihydro-3-hydroxyanthranilate isomerase
VAGSLPYEVVDVFTSGPYAGNPLAVVLDAEGLPDEALQAIAREFNLSETAFPMRPTVAEATYRVRIFTPSAEMPFAGHPSVGTAHTLARLGRIPVGAVTQECLAGLVPLQVDAVGAVISSATLSVGGDHDPAPYLAAVGLTLADLAPYPVRDASAGLSVLFLPVRAGAVSRARLDLAALAATGLPANLSVFAWDADTGVAHARVFAAAFGVPEDPATGSAALAFGAWLVSAGLVPPDGVAPFTVTQGAEMGRPSTMIGTVTAAGGIALAGTVGGSVAPVASGRLTAPDFQALAR